MKPYHTDNDVMLLQDFYVISVISNPARYSTRYDLYEKFEKRMLESGVKLLTVELQLGQRSFQVTDASNPFHLQLRSDEELWHKENMINLGIAKLPHDWKYVAWIDADVEFVNRDGWALETVQQLQHFQIVQLFQNCIDLGPNGQTLQTHCGFVWSYLERKPFGTGYSYWHPGYGWAANRYAIDSLGQLFDVAILGSGDRHMALGLIGQAQSTFDERRQPLNNEYVRHVLRWQDRATKYIKRDIGFVPGTILHEWHGKKKDRKYVERWEILIRNGYDPEQDLKRDWQGVYSLTDRSIQLRDDLRFYLKSRNEDSIDLY